MTTLAFYDPPLCCSSGVCGPTVDPRLPRVAADLAWLGRQGVAVERFNLAQQPQAFAANPVVTAALREHGNDCLPLVLVNGAVVSRGCYPTRTELARLAGLEVVPPPGTPTEPTASCGTPSNLVTLGDPARKPGGCC